MHDDSVSCMYQVTARAITELREFCRKEPITRDTEVSGIRGRHWWKCIALQRDGTTHHSCVCARTHVRVLTLILALMCSDALECSLMQNGVFFCVLMCGGQREALLKEPLQAYTTAPQANTSGQHIHYSYQDRYEVGVQKRQQCMRVRVYMHRRRNASHISLSWMYKCDSAYVLGLYSCFYHTAQGFGRERVEAW